MQPESVCLIVEDNIETQNFLAQVVQKAFRNCTAVFAKNLGEAVRQFEASLNEKKPIRICLVDLGLPDGSGIEFIRKVRAAGCDVPCVVATIYDGDDYLFGALSAGASGYIVKSDDEEYMAQLLARIEAGEPPLSPSIARRLLGYFQSEKVREPVADNLSPRERETLHLLSQGKTVPESARAMGLSPQTVAGYVKIIYQKLHVSNRIELINEASRRGII